jgi:hypothetical protein
VHAKRSGVAPVHFQRRHFECGGIQKEHDEEISLFEGTKRVVHEMHILRLMGLEMVCGHL